MFLSSLIVRKYSSSVPSTLRIGPSVRNLLLLYGLKPSSVPATGPKNALLKADILKFIKQEQLKPRPLSQLTEEPSSSTAVGVLAKPVSKVAPGIKFNDIEITGMRKTIAKRLTQSKTSIPHAYMTSTCWVNSLQRLRSSMKKDGLSVSLNDMLIKTTAVTLRRVPQVNGIWDEQKGSIKMLPNVDISVAVATETGLITPIVKNADILSVLEINRVVGELAESARMGRLKPEEFIGGSFSISNLGMFGISHFSAVINPPQAAILAIGGIKPAVSESHELSQTIDLTLSYDTRCIDLNIAAEFMTKLSEIISSPSLGIV